MLSKTKIRIFLIFLERVFKNGGAFLITIMIAKYLSIDEFGAIAYGQSLVQIFGVICTFGLNGIVQKKIITANEEEKIYIIQASMILQMVLAVLSILVGFLYLEFTNESELNKLISIILIFGLTFKSYETLKLYNEAIGKFGQNAFIELIASTVLISMLLWLLMTSRSAAIVCVVLAFEGGVSLLLYLFTTRKLKVFSTKIKSFEKVKELAVNCWPIFLNSMFGIIYMKIDSIIVAEYLGVQGLAQYAANVRIIELGYILPTIIMPVMIPELVRRLGGQDGEFRNILKLMYRFFLGAGFFFVVLLAVLGEYALKSVFSDEYWIDSYMMIILSVTLIPVFLGVINTQHLILIAASRVIYYRTFLGMVVMLILCLALTPKYGLHGAAVARLIGFLVATFSLFAFREGRDVFDLMSNAFSLKEKKHGIH